MTTYGRNVSYDIPDPELPEISQWLISNPNRVNLGRIGLQYQGATLSASQITNEIQELDLWNGVITSTFDIAGEGVRVVTQGDFDSDAVTFHVESELLASGDLEVELDFPYPPIHSTKYKYEVFAGVYDFPLNHTTTIVKGCRKDEIHIRHVMQETKYYVNLRWPVSNALSLSRVEPPGSDAITAHRYTLAAASKSRHRPNSLDFTAHFSPDKRTAPAPSSIRERNPEGWHQYWNEGGFVDLTSSTNPNATELQRRIVLSQYHVRVNSAAKGQSPQESGLMNNGWYGMWYSYVSRCVDNRLMLSRQVSHGNGRVAQCALVHMGEAEVFR